MRTCKVEAILNQKGGTGKTTTAINMGAALSKAGKKVLLVDADPQGNLTTALGWQQPDELDVTLATHMAMVVGDEPFPPDAGLLHHKEGFDIMPGNIELSGVELALVNVMSREHIMKQWLKQIKNSYDYVIIDCNSSLGMLTLNALASADSVIIPVQAQYLPAKGMTELVKTYRRVKRQINPGLQIDGVLLTLYDARTNLAKQTEREIRRDYGGMLKVFNSIVPTAVSAAEATAFGKSVLAYDAAGKAAEAYRKLTEEVTQIGSKKRTAAQPSLSR